MQIFKTLPESMDKISLALGFFDGVHLAHREIIKSAVNLAKENKIKSAVITFIEAPYAILFNKKPAYIMPLKDKIKEIENMGVDMLFFLDFNNFKEMRADEYLKKIIIECFNPKFVITGFNHTFGLNKEGNSKLLREQKSFKYMEIPPVKLNDTVISSTNIRNYIKEGNIKLANKMLGRNFSYCNNVIKGAQIARKLGYKTANLIWKNDLIKPKYGVYRGYTEYNNKFYNSMINFGLRPTVDKNLKETLEVHLFDFDDNLYGENIKIFFLDKIRDEVKFNSIGDLKNQIDEDYKIISVQNKTNAE